MEDGQKALIAVLYYAPEQLGIRDQLTQGQISRLLGLPRWQIVEAIKEAKRDRLVRFSVDYVGDRHDILEYQLSRELGLDRRVTRVARLRESLFSNESGPHGAEEHRRWFAQWAVGKMAAMLTEELIKLVPKGGKLIIGVSWGKTLRQMVDAISPLAAQGSHTDLIIVPTAGAVGGGKSDSNTLALEVASNTLVNDLRRAVGFGTSYTLAAPGYVESPETQDELLKLHLTKEVVGLWKEADLLLSGLGGMTPEATSLATWAQGLLTKEDFEILKECLDAAGDLSLSFFDFKGKPLQEYVNDPQVKPDVKEILKRLAYPIAAELAHLRRAASTEGKHSIAVGAGTGKVRAFVGAARGKYIDGLVTDSDTAAEILEVWNQGRHA